MNTIANRLCAIIFIITLAMGGVFFTLVANSAKYQKASFAPQTRDGWLNGSFGAKFDRFYKDEFPLKEFSVTAMNALSYQIFGEARKGAVIGKDGWIFSDEEFTWPSDVERNIQDHLAFITQTQTTLSAKGTRLIIALIPQKASIYPEHVGQVRLPSGQDQLYNRLFAELSKTKTLELADVKTALLAAKPKQEVFLKLDTHWTVAGATVVASAIAKLFPDVPPAEDSVFLKTEQPKLDHAGDLLKFVNLGRWEFLLPVKSEVIVPIKATPTNTNVDDFLVDTAAAPEAPAIVLVGTSYSANAQWSFESELKLFLQQDVLNKAEEGMGFVKPMENFLIDFSQTNLPPKTVIWEIPVRYFVTAIHL